MTSDQYQNDEALNKAAMFLAQALKELQPDNGVNARVQQDISESRVALERLAQRFEQQLVQEQEQRVVLAGQLTGLATALDRLVNHLQGLSQLMGDLLQRLAEPPAPVAAPAAPSEPSFPAGGEGVSLALTGVAGFQALMEIQKALNALEQVSNASVERFQEGDSRILLLLSASATGEELASGIHAATGFTVVVEESRPELLRLKLKILPS